MLKTRFTLLGFGFLVGFVGWLAACGGASPREQALEATLAALQTRPAEAEFTTTAAAGTSFPILTPAVTLPPAISSTANPLTGTLAARIDAYIRDISFNGTILVAVKGKLLVSQGYGLADRENEVPNTPQTKFAIGSLTKSFTSMAVMILQERGQLTVQDPICSYIADCPAAWKPITLHHLLTHTSGIHNYTDLAPEVVAKVNLSKEYKPEEIISLFKDLPLDFTPADRWSYSNSGFFLLGYVIEKASGESYETFIQKNILQPLGMTETGYDRASTIVKNRASGYSFDQAHSQFVNALNWDVSQRYAAGGLYSSVGDLYKWDQALYTDQLVSKVTLNTIFTSTVTVPVMNGFPYGGVYGYGWVISRYAGHRIIEHSGGFWGFSAYLARYPDDQITVIVLCNLDTTNPISIGGALADFVFEGG